MAEQDTGPGFTGQPAADPVAARLALISVRNEQYIRKMALTEWTVAHEDPSGVVRLLLAALGVALAALARHQQTITDSKGTICAGCLSEWPCPDSAAVRSALLAEGEPHA